MIIHLNATKFLKLVSGEK